MRDRRAPFSIPCAAFRPMTRRLLLCDAVFFACGDATRVFIETIHARATSADLAVDMYIKETLAGARHQDVAVGGEKCLTDGEEARIGISGDNRGRVRWSA